MRARVSNTSRPALFSELHKLGYDVHRIAQITSVTQRTVLDWKRGKYSIPYLHLQHIASTAKLNLGSYEIYLSDDWAHTRKAGRLGAAASIAKHGLPGTIESRRKGGINSYGARKNIESDIFTRVGIITPLPSEELAEFIGVMIGDGNLTKYQASIALSSIVDTEYCAFISSLTEHLFGLKPKVLKLKNANCLTVTCSSVKLVEFLQELGLPIGDKVRQNHTIPSWILGERSYTIACLRGIFDTDGCIFAEIHAINGKSYSYPRMSFVSASSALRETIYNALCDLEFEPKMRNNRSINLERRTDVDRYFEIVGTSNSKHRQRFNNFGEVA